MNCCGKLLDQLLYHNVIFKFICMQLCPPSKPWIMTADLVDPLTQKVGPGMVHKEPVFQWHISLYTLTHNWGQTKMTWTKMGPSWSMLLLAIHFITYMAHHDAIFIGRVIVLSMGFDVPFHLLTKHLLAIYICTTFAWWIILHWRLAVPTNTENLIFFTLVCVLFL